MKLVSESLFEFEKGQEPKMAIGIGNKARIKKWWETHMKEWNDEIPPYSINQNGEIDTPENFRFPWRFDEELPHYIKFGTIGGDFQVSGQENLKNLDFLPNHVKGDFEFYGNNIKLTPKKMKDLDIQIDGKIILLDPMGEEHREANKRYRKRGPVKDRDSILLSDPIDYGPKHTPGYQLYKMLKYMESTGEEGARYTDLIQIAWDISNPGLAGERPYSSGWGVGYFSPKWKSPIGAKADKNKKGRWVINTQGKQWLKNKADIFENPKF